ncbi:PRC and DUF2382 domain-containing protein [Streptomyces sp. CA-294286]|uniref:PRC and DUF2382 domain-containing protein n=1 Tax=Streptomyces sp. CA-294286 TaxID=3240070 RepID=UPI003D93D3FC
MSDFLNADRLFELTVHDKAGEKIGRIGQLYRDDTTGRPEWVTVKTGLFGTKETFVPLEGARVEGDDLRIPYAKDTVKDAPRVDVDGHLDVEEETTLFRHYGLTDTRSAGPAGGLGRAGTAPHDRSAERGTAASESGRTADRDQDHGLVRSEEQLRVGTEEVLTGTARLKKIVVTEEVATTVPVSHEEVRVVREPIKPGDTVRADIGEEETEVLLHAERPVTSKAKVPVERVRLETDKVTEQQEVTGTVRKEQIQYDDGTTDRHAKDARRDGRGRRGPSH